MVKNTSHERCLAHTQECTRAAHCDSAGANVQHLALTARPTRYDEQTKRLLAGSEIGLTLVA
ncbi:hypothetical protein TSA66_09730 [Noviherbaspirillum autotrophicum]|uniref:Uncharacterized protein n=1 Tax=Noviherbaspirillum autotrophicum TaxID=709839 RepID=A0A0C1Y1V7_9BURK|nr:hypothetical protein TSA66_09730 [Noviherbaspirillum autotrophicum]